MDKKYLSISELSTLTGVSLHRLRYAENSVKGLSVKHVRGRRYYDKKNVEIIAEAFNINLQELLASRRDSALENNQALGKIDQLLVKFNRLVN